MALASDSALGIVAYLALFSAVGIIFLFANLLIGRLVRPSDPHPEKTEIYECGEPAVGSSFVQFDLRFYVVALLFIIFDVEVAFFFPWAAVFGKSTQMAESSFEVVETSGGEVTLTRDARNLYRELGVRNPQAPTVTPASLIGLVDERASQRARSEQIIKAGSNQLAWFTFYDICVFFAVLMSGFAYVWKRGDLNWVRAVSAQHGAALTPPARGDPPNGRGRASQETVLSV